MKTPLQACTENLFRHSYAARRLGRRDKQVIESLVVMSYVPSRRIGRAALRVLRDIRTMPAPDHGSAA